MRVFYVLRLSYVLMTFWNGSSNPSFTINTSKVSKPFSYTISICASLRFLFFTIFTRYESSGSKYTFFNAWSRSIFLNFSSLRSRAIYPKVLPFDFCISLYRLKPMEVPLSDSASVNLMLKVCLKTGVFFHSTLLSILATAAVSSFSRLSNLSFTLMLLSILTAGLSSFFSRGDFYLGDLGGDLCRGGRSLQEQSIFFWQINLSGCKRCSTSNSTIYPLLRAGGEIRSFSSLVCERWTFLGGGEDGTFPLRPNLGVGESTSFLEAIPGLARFSLDVKSLVDA